MTDSRHVLDTLKAVIDPDVGVDIVELGLVERVEVDDLGIRVGLIMTTPACPQTSYLCDEAARLLAPLVPGGRVTVDILDQPLWEPARMSKVARAALGWSA